MIVPYPVDITGGFGIPADMNAGNQAVFLGTQPPPHGCTPGPNPPIPPLFQVQPPPEIQAVSGSTVPNTPVCPPGPNPAIAPPIGPVFPPCWMIDIADQYGNRLVSSVPLVTGAWPAANILAPYDYLGIGSAFIINQSGGAADIPNASNLGSQFILLWDSNPGMPPHPIVVPLTNAPNQSVTVGLPINGGSIALNLRIYYNEGF